VKLGLAIAEVRDAELALASQLKALGERHKADHDVFHLSRTLQAIVRANLGRLEPVAGRYDTDIDPSDAPVEHGQGPFGKAREKASEISGRRPEPGLLLLRDLRTLHLLYAGASINWVILGQGAQAAKDEALLAVVSECHPQTLRGMKWTVTRLKTAAPQVLTS
jgi:hypothetical protein